MAQAIAPIAAHTITTDTEPRVWIGCLACYSAGRLVGQWVDATEATAPTPDDIHGHPTTHEEMWVFDHEGFLGALVGECSPAEAQRVAEIIEACTEYGPREAVAAWLADDLDHGMADSTADDFAESYAGEWDDLADFAEDMITSGDGLDHVPAELRPYFDFEAYGRDLQLGGDVWTAEAPGGRVYVFRNL